MGNFNREGVNAQPAGSTDGQNDGWPISEGSIGFKHNFLTCSAKDLTLPVADDNHSHGCKVVGGAFYAGEGFPGPRGTFAVANLCTSRIKEIKPSNGNATRGNTTV